MKTVVRTFFNLLVKLTVEVINKTFIEKLNVNQWKNPK